MQRSVNVNAGSLVKIFLLIAFFLFTGVSISIASSPPPLPNSFFGNVIFIESAGSTNAPDNTLIEALIDNTIKETSIVTTQGIYDVDVESTSDNHGKNITFLVNNFVAEQEIDFDAFNAPPRALDLTVDLSGDIPVTTSFLLTSGWNLFSLSLIPENTDIASALSSINGNYNIVWEYNASDTADHWKKYDPAAPFGNDLSNLEPGKGYWIMVPSSSRMIVSGNMQGTPINLYEGWNLIGYNSFKKIPIITALSSIDGNYNIVWAYDASDPADKWKKYDPSAPFGNDLEIMEPGKGYWIMMKTDDILEI